MGGPKNFCESSKENILEAWTYWTRLMVFPLTMINRLGIRESTGTLWEIMMKYLPHSSRSHWSPFQGRQMSFWYQMKCIWFNILHPSAAASCLVRTSVVLGKIYSGWALSAVFYGASSVAPGEEGPSFLGFETGWPHSWRSWWTQVRSPPFKLCYNL